GLYAANAYDATKLILAAVSNGKIDRGNIIEAVRGRADYPGASGLVSFDENGDRHGWRISGYRVEGGLFVFDRLLVSKP
ncbi:MAG: branched-chain amino acid ABC transporter substrate-binding protein, partial [Chloroflexia bacterium]